LIVIAGTYTLLKRGRCRLKSRNVELHVSVDIGRELRSLGQCDVFAVHEQEEWCSGEKHNASRHDSRRHPADVSPATASLHRTQGCLVAAQQFHIVDVDLKFASPRHSSLRLSFRNCAECKTAFGNHERPVYADVLQHFEIHSISHVRVGGRNGPIESELHWRRIFQYKSLCGCKVRSLSRLRRRRWLRSLLLRRSSSCLSIAGLAR